MLLLVGCGRLGFSTMGDALGDDDGGGGDAGDGSVQQPSGLVAWLRARAR